MDFSGRDGRGYFYARPIPGSTEFRITLPDGDAWYDARKCPADKQMIMVNYDGDMRNAYAQVDLNVAVVPTKRAIHAGLTPALVTLHEYAHLFKLADEYYDATDHGVPGGNCSAMGIMPCQMVNGGVFGRGQGWCRAANMWNIPDSSPCKGLDVHDGWLGGSACTNKQGCQGKTTFDDRLCAGRSAGQCALDSRCQIGKLCFVYISNVCMDRFADYNLGTDCDPGTGCFPGCGAFRSSARSIMNFRSEFSAEFNAVQKEIISQVIECSTSVAIACPVISQPSSYSDPL